MTMDDGRRPLRITLTAMAVLLLGVVLAGGVGYLTSLDGSWYYLVAGIGLIIVAGLLFAQQRVAIALYGLLLLGTLT